VRYFFSKMWPFVRRSLPWVLLGSVGGLLTNVLKSAVPVALGRALDSVLAVEHAPYDPSVRSRLVQDLLLFLCLSVLYSEFRAAKRLGFRYTENRTKRHLREAGLSNLLHLPFSRLCTMRVGDVMSRMVGDVDLMSNTVRRTLTEIFDTAVMMAVAFGVLMHYNFRLTLMVMLPLPFVVLSAEAVGRAVQRRSLSARTAVGAVVAHLQEAISGMRVLRLLGCEEGQVRRLESLTRREVEENLSVTRLQAGVLPLCSVLAHVGTLAVVWVGGGAVCRGEMSVGDLMAYLILYQRAVQRTLVMARVLNLVHAGRAALTRTEAFLEGSKSTRGPKAPRRPVEMKVPKLSFAHLGAREPVLEGMDVTAGSGQLVAVTGPVGSGKTTLARALSGLYPWREGHVELDGRAVEPEDLLGTVAYCPQDPFLFSGTVEENVAFGVEPDPELVRYAAYLAALDEDEFPEGFRTQVGEGGFQVSGGQRQRIALARAIYSRRKLLVLDDPFSSVDLATERLIVEHMREHLKDRIIILISHRLSAFVEADEVLVLYGGRVAEQGTHERLMRSGKIYPAIYRAQLRLKGDAGCAS